MLKTFNSVKKYIALTVLAITIIPCTLFAGTLSGTVKDWLGGTITGKSFKIYVYELNSSAGDLKAQAYIQETTSSSSNGSWTITDVSIITGEIYYVVYFYGGCHTGSDNTTQCNMIASKYQTAE